MSGWLARLLTLAVCGWTGAVLAIAFLAAPAAFAVLPSADAGLVAARLFKFEAYGSIFVGALAWILMRGAAPTKDWPLWIAVLLALIATIIGYFGLAEQLQQLKAQFGASSPQYGRLHGVSMVLYALKGCAWLALSVLLVVRLDKRATTAA